jgi:hypothetical protein
MMTHGDTGPYRSLQDLTSRAEQIFQLTLGDHSETHFPSLNCLGKGSIERFVPIGSS